MQNKVITNWNLSPIEKFECFLIELIDFLKSTMVPIEDPDGQISYTCTKDLDYDDPDYMEPFERVAHFCIEKNLDPHETIDMIDEYTDGGYDCEFGLLEDEKIVKLINRQKTC